ncbi:MAG: PAS domain S-box protein [Planctomycetes bacterium]|nr:PAS domain S-box protein [Planctomycetota bacterium]
MFTYNKNTFLNINKIIFSSLDIREVYQTMSNELSKIIDFDRLTITLITEDNDLYEAFVVQSKMYENTDIKKGDLYPMKGSLMEKVVQSNSPVIVDDTAKSQFVSDTVLFKEGIRSRMGFPLVYKGCIMKHQKLFHIDEKKYPIEFRERIIGSINFGSKRRKYYSKKHVDFVSKIAPQLAMAIENTRLFNRIKDAEEKYRAVVESSPDIIFECTGDGKFFLINPSVEKILGYSVHYFYDNQGYGLSLCHEDDQERVQSEILQLLNGEKNSLMDFEFRVIHKQGKVVWLSLEALPIKQNDKIIGIEGFCRDITERKKLDELKNNLIRDVTHELKTPVAKMEMAIDMYKRSFGKEKEFSNEKGLHVHNLLQNNIHHLKNIIRNVLDLSKLESGVEHLNVTGFPFIDLVEQVISELNILSIQKNNTITHQIPADMILKADKDKMYYLLVNLVGNAIKFTDNGKIDISSRITPKGIEVTVKDTGRGLGEEALKHAFDKFYKETSSLPGSGIGLTICKNIVELHDGSIWAESDGRGKGAKFIFRLPLPSSAK